MATRIQLDTSLLRAVQRRIVADTRQAIPDILTVWANGVLQYVQARPRFKPRTGALLKATKWEFVRRSNEFRIFFVNRKKYAASIEWGARPHVIRAVRAPFLVFFWEKMGKWVTTKKVNHPGNQPYQFLSSAIRVSRGRLESALSSALSSIARH